jgi:hypothetical protein
MVTFLQSRRCLGLVAVLLAAFSGCSKGQVEVTGKVTYRNEPLPAGTIQFLGSNGLPYAAPIGPDGSYTVCVPEGEAKVIVVCRDEAQMNAFFQKVGANATGRAGRTSPAPAQSDRPSRQVPFVPQRYADWDASRLTATIETGNNTIDFALQD